MAEALEEQNCGATTVLFGPSHGRYPDGNSLLVRGREETVLIDPSLGVRPRRSELDEVSWCLASHCHEDHVAGLDLFGDKPFRLHEADAPGIASLDGFLAIYGFPPEIEEPFRSVLTEQFHVVPRSDAEPFADGARFDLGGASITAVHTPGHTRGHCCLLVESAGNDPLLYLGDIDLSSFGPYYGDAWSDLEDFERSLALVRDIPARWYATFHHIGVLERDAFLERLGKFTAVIASREERLLSYLLEAPRSLAEIAEHRFVYRPGDAVLFADAVERRSMSQHLERLIRDGAVAEIEPGRFRQI